MVFPKRKYARHPIAVEVEAQLHGDDPAATSLIFDSVDLGLGGMFLRSELLLEVGDELDLAIWLPGREAPLLARGRVAWVARLVDLKGQPGMGVSFTKMDGDAQAVLTAFLAAKP